MRITPLLCTLAAATLLFAGNADARAEEPPGYGPEPQPEPIEPPRPRQPGDRCNFGGCEPWICIGDFCFPSPLREFEQMR